MCSLCPKLAQQKHNENRADSIFEHTGCGRLGCIHIQNVASLRGVQQWQVLYLRTLGEVKNEIDRSNNIHGQQEKLPDIMWQAIASEEAGEAVKAALQEDEGLYEECIQAAAMFAKWAANIQHRGYIGWRGTITNEHAT